MLKILLCAFYVFKEVILCIQIMLSNIFSLIMPKFSTQSHSNYTLECTVIVCCMKKNNSQL